MKRLCRVLVAGFFCLSLVLPGLLALSVGLSSGAFAQMMVVPGTFDVTSEGTASFSIPVLAPPGSGGMVPSLSLDYASGGANGVAGMGWTIDGLPAITRCPQTLAQDGNAGSITYDVGVAAGQTDNDRFCLNGQRLVAISGNYGANDSEYRTENESFSRIISHGTTGSSPSFFDVYTKSGRVMEFGNTTDSRAMFPSASKITSPRAWLLDKIADNTGNYLTVEYSVNPDSSVANNSEVVPAEIDYTGNPGRTLNGITYPNVAPYNKITFVYTNGTRPDIFLRYADGNLVETTQLLTDIKTWSGTQASPGSTEVNDYQFAYTASASTGRELLTSATLCDGAGGNCLPSRVFNYSAEPSGALFTVHSSTLGGWHFGTPPSAYWTPIVGDFIGNGRTDFAFISNNQLNVALSNGDGTFSYVAKTLSGLNFGAPPTASWTPIVGDFNGDGRTDFALISGSNSGNQIYSFLSNGDGTFNIISQVASGNLGSPSGTYWNPITGDFYGNGLTDVAFVGPSSIYILTSKGDGTFSAYTQNLGSLNFGAPPSAYWTPVTGDFTGNGKTDFALISGIGSSNQIYTFLSNGSGTFNVGSQVVGGYLGAPPSAYWTPITGDFNGDGLTDVTFITGDSNGEQNDLFTLMSMGNGQFAPISSTNYGGLGTPPSAGWALVQGDFTGAGMTDFGFLNANSLATFTSNGTGTFTEGNQTLTTNYGSPPTSTWTPVDGDFTGNGQDDFALISNGTVNTYLSNDVTPDLLTSVTNGVGATTSISYGTPAAGGGSYYTGWSNSSSNVCYANRANYNYPATSIDITPAIPVVTSVSNSNGIGGNYSFAYAYSCALADTTGRGYLGFANQVVADQQTGTNQSTSFLQNYPYIGAVASQTKTVTVSGTTITLESLANTYAALTSNSSPALAWNGTQTGEVAPQFPYVSQTVDTRNDLNGAALPTTTTSNTYDAYGDLLTVAISQELSGTQGPTQTTTNTYLAPNTTGSKWLIGLLSQSQVVRTTP